MKKCLFLIGVCVVLSLPGCGRKEMVIPELSFYKDNSLLPSIEFKTRQSSEVYIEYWPTNNRGRVQRSKTSTGESHRLVLLNLKQETSYNYTIHNITTGKRSDVFTFETRTIPDEIVRAKKSLIDTSQFNGFVLIRRLAPKGSDVIIDKEGDIVWYHLYDTTVRRPFTWTDHGSILSIYDSAQIVEHDLYGNTILNIKLEEHGVPNSLHHEVLYNDKNEIVALTLDSIKMDMRKLGGSTNQNLQADGIIVLSKTGQKVWEWNLLSQYNPVENSRASIDYKQSIGHANSMTIDKDGNYVVSLRDFAQIWKVNSIDGSVIWKLGKDGDIKMDKEDYFIAQHSIYFNKQGELMVFDNGDKSRPNSRVLSFILDEKAMEARIGINVVLPVELSAEKMCSADVIAEGKYLICTSKKNGIVSVVNDDGTVLWRVDLSFPSYRAYYLQDPFSID